MNTEVWKRIEKIYAYLEGYEERMKDVDKRLKAIERRLK
jgi:hypothetical protein